MSDKPRSMQLEVFTYICVFLVFSAAAVWATTQMASLSEIPWTWYWAIWATLFSPTVLVTTFSAASVDPPLKRLAAAYFGSLVLTIVTLVGAMILDVPFYGVLGVVAIVCGIIWLLFRVIEPVLPSGPTSLRF